MKLIFRFIANLIILLIISRFVTGFELALQPINLLSAAVIFFALNSYFRPLIKTIFSPFVLITLGLFGLFINAGMLYLLDIISENISINGLLPLWQSTLIITFFNILIGILI